MMAESSDELKTAFQGAVQYSLDTGFTEILEFKVLQEEALPHLASLRQAWRCACGAADWMREIFNLPA